MSNQINKVTKQEIDEAINYLFVSGYVEEMTSDKRYYVEVLLKAVGNQLGYKLEFDE
jgi:hypothetical protein